MHLRWVMIYNANLDRATRNRKSVHELRQELKHWEEEKARRKKHTVEDVDRYQVVHLSPNLWFCAMLRSLIIVVTLQREYHSEFQRLVENARPKQGPKATALAKDGDCMSSANPQIICTALSGLQD